MVLYKFFTPKYITLLFLLIGIETVAQYFLKQQTNIANSKVDLMLGCISYMAVGLVYYLFLTSKTNLTLANNVWNVGTAITVTLVGVVMFNEKISLLNWFGLLMALSGVYLLSLK